MTYYIVQYIDNNRCHESSGYFKLYESLEDACKFAVNEYWQSCHLDGHECRDLTCLFHLSVEDQVNLLMHDFDAYQDIVYPFFQKTCDKDYDHEMFRIVKVDVEK